MQALERPDQLRLVPVSTSRPFCAGVGARRVMHLTRFLDVEATRGGSQLTLGTVRGERELRVELGGAAGAGAHCGLPTGSSTFLEAPERARVRPRAALVAVAVEALGARLPRPSVAVGTLQKVQEAVTRSPRARSESLAEPVVFESPLTKRYTPSPAQTAAPPIAMLVKVR